MPAADVWDIARCGADSYQRSMKEERTDPYSHPLPFLARSSSISSVSFLSVSAISIQVDGVSRGFVARRYSTEIPLEKHMRRCVHQSTYALSIYCRLMWRSNLSGLTTPQQSQDSLWDSWCRSLTILLKLKVPYKAFWNKLPIDMWYDF